MCLMPLYPFFILLFFIFILFYFFLHVLICIFVIVAFLCTYIYIFDLSVFLRSTVRV